MKRLRLFLVAAMLLALPAWVCAGPGATLKKSPAGLEVQSVAPKGWVDQLGLQPKDVILQVNGRAVSSDEELTDAIRGQRSLKVEYTRGGKSHTGDYYVYWPPAPSSKPLPGMIKKYVSPKDQRNPVIVKIR